MEATICVMCGHDIESTISSSTMNSIEFTEDKNGRSFKANFTDNVGTHISQSLGLILANKFTSKVKSIQDSEQDFQEAEYQEEEASIKPLKLGDGDLSILKIIFQEEGGNTILADPRLKAKSKQDFGARLICLFLYYKKLQGFDKILRNELTVIAKHASIEDGNFRKWVKNENQLIKSENDQVKLLLPGSEFAKKVIADFQDDSIVETWKLGIKSKSGRRLTKAKNKSAQDENIEATPKNSASSNKALKVSSGKNSRKGPSQTLKDLIGSGFFKSKKTIGDIVIHCKESLALNFKANDLSGLLAKFVRDKNLTREKNTTTNQYEYTSL